MMTIQTDYLPDAPKNVTLVAFFCVSSAKVSLMENCVKNALMQRKRTPTFLGAEKQKTILLMLCECAFILSLLMNTEEHINNDVKQNKIFVHIHCNEPRSRLSPVVSHRASSSAPPFVP